MGFLKPKVPKAPPPPNPATTAMATESGAPSGEGSNALASLISTSSQGLRRKANTQRTSLIGGV